MKNILSLSAACGLLALSVAGCGGGGSNNGGNTYLQTDRLARPVVNEVFATFAGNRHLTNDLDNPTDDSGQLANDIQSFMSGPVNSMTGVAGRSQQTTDFVKSVLVPDVMIADLSKSGEAAYLGSETGGATSGAGSTFGGRKFTDDVVDISLGVIFGNTISAVTKGSVADDKKEIPTLTSDNVGPAAKNYSNSFPYLGTPK